MEIIVAATSLMILFPFADIAGTWLGQAIADRHVDLSDVA